MPPLEWMLYQTAIGHSSVRFRTAVGFMQIFQVLPKLLKARKIQLVVEELLREWDEYADGEICEKIEVYELHWASQPASQLN